MYCCSSAYNGPAIPMYQVVLLSSNMGDDANAPGWQTDKRASATVSRIAVGISAKNQPVYLLAEHDRAVGALTRVRVDRALF